MSRRRTRRNARGGSTPRFNPLQLGPYIWVEADSGVTQVANRISATVSKVTSISYLQATGANQPLYTAADASFNNLPTIGIDGAARYMQATGLSIPYPFSVFEFGSHNSAGTTYASVIGNGALIGQAWEYVAGVAKHLASDGTLSRGAEIADAQTTKRSMYMGCSTGKVSTVIRNAGTPVVGSLSTAPTGSTMNFSNIGHTSLANIRTVAVHMIFRYELSTAQVAKLHNWFVAKYGAVS